MMLLKCVFKTSAVLRAGVDVCQKLKNLNTQFCFTFCKKSNKMYRLNNTNRVSITLRTHSIIPQRHSTNKN